MKRIVTVLFRLVDLSGVLTSLAIFLSPLKAPTEQLIDTQRLRADLTRGIADAMPAAAGPLRQLNVR